MSNILVIGATGTIGSAVADAFEEAGHSVVRASRSASASIDIEDPEKVTAFFAEHGPFDNVICCAGRAEFGPLSELEGEKLELGIQSKLKGQIAVTRAAVGNLNWPGTAGVAAVNGALEGFVRGAAVDLQDSGVRINLVSPPLVLETAQAMGMGDKGVPAAQVAQAYLKAAAHDGSGDVIFVEGADPTQ